MLSKYAFNRTYNDDIQGHKSLAARVNIGKASVAPRSKHNSVLVVLARCRVLSKINVHGNAWLISCSFHMLHGVVQESLKCCSDYFFLAVIPGTFPSLNAIPSLCVVCKNTIVLLRPLPGKGVLIILVRLL